MTKIDAVRAAPIAEKPGALGRYRQCALRHCEIVSKGKIDVPKVDRAGDKYKLKDRMILYLIGKYYAFCDETASSAEVGYQELKCELGLKTSNSLRPPLHGLRKKGELTRTRRGKTVFYAIREECIIPWLDRIDKRYAGRRTPGVVVRRTGVALDERQIMLDADLPITRPTRVEVAVTIPDEPAPKKT
jgi:hypothetical protein